MAYTPFKMKGYSPYRKDQIVSLSDQKVRIKPVKNLGNDVQAQTIKQEDKSTITNRYKKGNLVDSNYNPSKIKTKKIRKKSIRVPSKLKNVKSPEYNSKTNVSEKDEMVYKYNKKKRQTVKDPKKKSKKVKNLVTGKTNKISW